MGGRKITQDQQLIDDLAGKLGPDEPVLFSTNGMIRGEHCGVIVTPYRILTLSRGVFGGDRICKFRFSELSRCELTEHGLTLAKDSLEIDLLDLACDMVSLHLRIRRLQLEHLESGSMDLQVVSS